MNHVKNSLLIIIGFLLFFSCKKAKEEPQPVFGAMEMQYVHMMGMQNFDFNKDFTNSSGETFKVNTLSYILSNFKLRKSDNSEVTLANTYFLMDPIVGNTFSIANVPEGDYVGMSYMIGVDSTTTAGGAKAGALDPVNERYWSWQTGFINFRMIGSGAGKVFDYDIGGFLAPYQTVQTVSHDFGDETLIVRPSTKPVVHVNVDLLELFKNPLDISINAISTIATPGANAKKVADNYKDMFLFQHIHN